VIETRPNNSRRGGKKFVGSRSPPGNAKSVGRKSDGGKTVGSERKALIKEP